MNMNNNVNRESVNEETISRIIMVIAMGIIVMVMTIGLTMDVVRMNKVEKSPVSEHVEAVNAYADEFVDEFFSYYETYFPGYIDG